MSQADDVPLEVVRTDDDVVIATLRNGKVNALSNRVLTPPPSGRRTRQGRSC